MFSQFLPIQALRCSSSATTEKHKILQKKTQKIILQPTSPDCYYIFFCFSLPIHLNKNVSLIFFSLALRSSSLKYSGFNIFLVLSTLLTCSKQKLLQKKKTKMLYSIKIFLHINMPDPLQDYKLPRAWCTN